MRTRLSWRGVPAVLLLVAFAVGGTAHEVFATSAVSESPNYQMTESTFGSSSADEACSGEYCAKATIGDMAVGQGASANTAANFGTLTPDEPTLEVIVESGESNLGTLETNKTATKTMGIKVRSYLSNGYQLQIVGEPPKYGGHTLNAPAVPTASQPGTEQFGINLAANSTPNIGASPVQVPSAQISFGEAEPSYRTPNLFKFNSGDVVASSTKESGRTDYTVSMIINVSNKTPAGHFSGDFSAVVIPIF